MINEVLAKLLTQFLAKAKLGDKVDCTRTLRSTVSVFLTPAEVASGVLQVPLVSMNSGSGFPVATVVHPPDSEMGTIGQAGRDESADPTHQASQGGD